MIFKKIILSQQILKLLILDSSNVSSSLTINKNTMMRSFNDLNSDKNSNATWDKCVDMLK